MVFFSNDARYFLEAERMMVQLTIQNEVWIFYKKRLQLFCERKLLKDGIVSRLKDKCIFFVNDAPNSV
jgi:hypothetical protein